MLDTICEKVTLTTKLSSFVQQFQFNAIVFISLYICIYRYVWVNVSVNRQCYSRIVI